MSVSLSFYLDAALTQPAAPAELAAIIGGAQDARLFLGSTVAGQVFRDAAAPGLDPIRIVIADSAPDTGQPAASCKVALTQAGLDAATPGAALAVALEITSGVAGARAFWLRWTPAGTTAGTYTDLSIQTTDVVEEAA